MQLPSQILCGTKHGATILLQQCTFAQEKQAGKKRDVTLYQTAPT